MENKKNTFKSKRLRIGGFGIVLTFVVIALVVMINVVVGKLPAKYTHFNMDTVDFFELGDETNQVLDGVKEDVNVYFVAEKGTEDPMIEEMLLRYESLSSKIKVKNIDPAVYPDFMSKYTEDKIEGDYFVVFESSKRSRIVTPSEIYYKDMSGVSEQDQLYAYLYGIEVGKNVFLGELAFTTAVDYVTRDSISTVYFLTGHGESTVDSYFNDLIKNENIVKTELDLQKTHTIPEDCTAIVSVLPTSDFSNETADVIISYLKAGGDFILITDSKTYSAEKRPGIAKVAKHAGLESIDGTIYDRQGTGFSGEFIPKFVESENRITSLVANPQANTAFFNAHGIKEIEGGSDAIINPLLKTSSDGVIRIPDGNGSFTVHEDYNGKVIYPAVQSDREIKDGKYGDSSTFVWFANSVMTDSQHASTTNNDEFFMAAVAYICKSSVSLSILGKTSEVAPLNISAAHADVMMLTVCVILPLIVLGAGFAVWFKRRKL